MLLALAIGVIPKLSVGVFSYRWASLATPQPAMALLVFGVFWVFATGSTHPNGSLLFTK